MMFSNTFYSLTLLAFSLLLFQSQSQAQTISGRVLDAKTLEPLAGANVVLQQTQSGTATGFDGSFTVRATSGDMLQVSFVGYETQRISASQNMRVLLVPTIQLEQLIIQAVRAESTDPVTQSTINRRVIQREYQGEQPIFFLEQLTPSITSFSESGTRVANYGTMRLRGISQERINFTLNGVPLNDMIDHGVFFSNFSDISGSFESVQVQRGAGTSANGVASYAGSVNFQSINLENSSQGGAVQTGIGSFGTSRLNAEVSSGMIDDKWAFYGNFSRLHSDGYRDNTSTDAYSFFFSGGYFGEKDVFKINAFDANSKNGLAYFAVPEAILDADPTANPLNENDKDDFGQRFVQLQYTRLLSDDASLTSSLYYGGASGDFLFTSITDSTASQFNFPLRNDHYGVMVNANYSLGNIELSSGLHGYVFDRVNEESTGPDFENPYYRETSTKTEFSWFGRANWKLNSLLLSADVQLRTMNLSIVPDNSALTVPANGDLTYDWTYLNPRIGVTYRLNENFSTYASIARTGREPTRIDIFGGEFSLTDSNVDIAEANDFNPEYVTNLEAGVKTSFQSLAVNANLFYMKFNDEIAAIGEPLLFGGQKRENIESSYRLGVELDWTYVPFGELTFAGNATYMKAEIEEFTNALGNSFTNRAPIFTPEFMFNQNIFYVIGNGISFGTSAQYIGKSFLALENVKGDVLPAAFVMDGFLSFAYKSAELRIQVNNLLDETYYSNGFANGDGTQSYFINAGRNFYASLKLNF